MKYSDSLVSNLAGFTVFHSTFALSRSIGENDHYVVPKRPVPADRPSSGETSEPAHKYRRRGKSRKSKTGKKKDAEEAENAQKEGENIEVRASMNRTIQPEMYI